MKKIKILFQGDSITDAGRDKRNYHQMGNGYPKFASALIAAAHPDIEFEFINLGISGNRTDQLFDRLYPDAIALEPDIISILIGVNDVWHRHSSRILTTDAQIELVNSFIADPDKFLHDFLVSHPDFLAHEIAKGGKSAQRAELCIASGFAPAEALPKA